MVRIQVGNNMSNRVSAKMLKAELATLLAGMDSNDPKVAELKRIAGVSGIALGTNETTEAPLPIGSQLLAVAATLKKTPKAKKEKTRYAKPVAATVEVSDQGDDNVNIWFWSAEDKVQDTSGRSTAGYHKFEVDGETPTPEYVALVTVGKFRFAGGKGRYYGPRQNTPEFVRAAAPHIDFS